MKKLLSLLILLILFGFVINGWCGEITIQAAVGAGSGDVSSVGDCTSGACFDGTSDGGTYLDFYDAQGRTRLIGGNTAAEVTLTLPTTTGTLIYSGGAFHDGFSDFVANEHIDWTASAGTIHTDNYVENVIDTLASTLGAGADANDVDITSLGKLEFFDAGLYLDADADGVMDITSDGTLELHSADWDISTTGAITNASIDADNNTVTNIVIGAECTGASTSLTDTADLLYEAELDSESELEAQIADMTNILQESEIDASSELLAIMDDETGSAAGTPLLVFNTNPVLTGATLAGILADNDDMVFECDADSNGSNKFSFTDGASAEIFSITEAGVVAASSTITAVGSFIIGSADMSEIDLEKLDGITNGTAAANKALVLDGSLNIATINSLTATTLVGALTGAASGNLLNSESDILTGTLTADGLTLGADENITLGSITLDYDSGIGEVLLNNDFEIEDASPHIGARDTDDNYAWQIHSDSAWDYPVQWGKWALLIGTRASGAAFVPDGTSGVLCLDSNEDWHMPQGDLFLNDARVRSTDEKCIYIENLAAADDNISLGSFAVAATITKVWISCRGTCTTKAEISLEDEAGNAMTHTVPTAGTWGTPATPQDVTANNTLDAYESLAFDVDNTPSPETDEYMICVACTIQ